MIKRLFLAALMLLVFMGSASAGAPVTMYHVGSNPYVSTADAACGPVAKPAGYTYFFSDENTCWANYTKTAPDYQKTAYASISKAMRCSPGGGAPDTTKPLDQQCPDNPCSAGPNGSRTITSGFATGPSIGSAVIPVIPDGGLTSATYCDGVCQISPTGFTPGGAGCTQSQTPGPNGYFAISCDVAVSKSGTQCTPAPAGTSPMNGGLPNTLPPPEPTPANTAKNGACPAGSVASGTTSDGMTTCAGAPKAPSAPAPTTTKTTAPVTTTDASGNSVVTSTSSVSNADGSTTTTTTTKTTAADGSVTTGTNSVTSNASGGSAPGTADRPEDKSDLCKLHPELNICKNSQVVGTCALTTCVGDAITCAILRTAQIDQCNSKIEQDKINAMGSKTLGDSIAAGTDPQNGAINTALHGTTTDLSSANLDQTGFAPSACFAPKTMNVMGRTFVVSFAAVCDSISPLRYAVVACATVLAYLIVSRSVLGA